MDQKGSSDPGKSLKKYSHNQIQNLIESQVNNFKHMVDEWLKSLPNDVGD